MRTNREIAKQIVIELGPRADHIHIVMVMVIVAYDACYHLRLLADH